MTEPMPPWDHVVRIDHRSPASTDGTRACPMCGGQGWHYASLSIGPDYMEMRNPVGCPDCRGTGKIPGFQGMFQIW